MKVLLDECVDRRLARFLSSHAVTTVPQAGWAGVKNGELLRRAGAAAVEAFITMDKSLPAQQSWGALPFAILVLRAPSNRVADLAPLAPGILAALAAARAGTISIVETAPEI